MCGSSRLVACETLQRERFEGWIMRVNTCSSLQKRRVSHTYYPFYESPNGADVLLRRDATWLENQEGYNRTAI